MMAVFFLQVEQQNVSVTGDIKRTQHELTQFYQEQGRREMEHKVSLPPSFPPSLSVHYSFLSSYVFTALPQDN